MQQDAARIAEELRAQIGALSGTLRLFGEWFGRPHDNIHRLEGATAEDDILVLRFDSGLLQVWQPHGLETRSGQPSRGLVGLRIRDASRVRWEWYYFGRPETQDNLRFLDYAVNGRKITRTSNLEADLQEKSTATASSAAVELIS